MMRIIGEPRCNVEAFDQSESELGKVILNFTAKFSLPGDSESDSGVVFHRIFVTPPDTVAALAMNEEEGRDIVSSLLELLLVPTQDEIVGPVFIALASVSNQITDWSLGLKATVAIDLHVDTLPPPPFYITEIAHLYFSHDCHDSSSSDDDDDDVDEDDDGFHGFDNKDNNNQVRFVPANESSIRALETVRVSTAEMECSVCLDDLTVETEATRLPCSHMFHGDCIVKWLNTSNFCPLCRFQINT